MHLSRSAGGCQLLSCTASCAVKQLICKNLLGQKCLNLHDGRDGCLVSTSVATLHGTKYMTTEFN